MPKELTLAEYLAGKVGLLKATKVAAFVVAWGIYMEKTEPVPTPYGRMAYTLDAYSDYWKQSISTTYKERDLFRICFPNDKTPERIWGVVREVYNAKASADQMGARLLVMRGVRV